MQEAQYPTDLTDTQWQILAPSHSDRTGHIASRLAMAKCP